MNYFFVDFYLADPGSGMLTSYVAAPSAVEAVGAIQTKYPGSRDCRAYIIPEIPQDCPYLNATGEIMRALADQPCEPAEACKTHGRCLTHEAQWAVRRISRASWWTGPAALLVPQRLEQH
jgi:hypothetical protein